MSAPTFGGSVAPTELANSGHVHFTRQKTRPNGASELIHYGEQAYEWTINGLPAASWDWLMTQYRRGTAMPFELWEDDSRRRTIAFTSGVLYEPQYANCEAGVYVGVKVEIHALMPLQA